VVDSVRDLKRMQFLIMRDHSGHVQGTNFKQGKSLDEVVSSLSQDVVIKAGGELVKSEKERTEYKAMLGKFRNLDLEFLISCSKTADYRGFNDYIAELKRSFDGRRNYLIEQTHTLIEKWRI
jgi:aspartyl-tRNA synthetase